MSEIRTNAYVVEVSASVMPPLTEDEIRDAVYRAALAKERQYGMGYLDVIAYEGFNERTGRSR